VACEGRLYAKEETSPRPPEARPSRGLEPLNGAEVPVTIRFSKVVERTRHHSRYGAEESAARAGDQIRVWRQSDRADRYQVATSQSGIVVAETGAD